MPNYRRLRIPGGCYFFTVVTHERRPVLTAPHTIGVLRNAVRDCRQRYPFTINAWVVLPDHIHALWTMPADDADFSIRWRLIKTLVTQTIHRSLPHAEAPFWQQRFWEHAVRDDDEYAGFVQYIHFNPVHHRLVSEVADWPHSTFHRYVRDGIYPASWAADPKIRSPAEFVE